MSFPLGGGSIKGISKPGEIVGSRIFVEHGRFNADIGLGRSVALPASEIDRRWSMTTAQWSRMNAVLSGVGRDQCMARHCSNQIQVAYVLDAAATRSVLVSKAALVSELEITEHLCGDCDL